MRCREIIIFAARMTGIVTRAGPQPALKSVYGMENPLLTESACRWGAPRFDLIKAEHYLPAFEAGIAEARAEIDAIVSDPDVPDFENTIEALEYSGRTLDRVSSVFFNLLEAESDEEMQSIAEKVSPMLTEYSMYVSLNGDLFKRVRSVYERKDGLVPDKDREKLLENTYRSFVRNGAALSDEDKKIYSKYAEELSLLSLSFGNNVLRSSNAYSLHITDSGDMDGLPDYVARMGEAAAKEKGLDGWVFTLDYPSYAPFMKYSRKRELRRQMYMAYNTKGTAGETDNTGIVMRMADLRLRMSAMLGYRNYADYALEENMAKTPRTVEDFLGSLMSRSLPFAKDEIARIFAYAAAHGFEDSRLMPWDLSFWAERYKEAEFSINEELLKPYFRLENCIAAVFDLAWRLYGIRFTEADDIPVYHKDVKAYDVTDEDGRHLAVFYADFFPREGKRGGAWMTEFRGQSIRNGVEERPLVSIVTNFTKPAGDVPSLLTHDELTTLLHEFGHALHGIMSEGRYPSLTGTSVARDFVELPSQIMENWAYEPEYLKTFARDFRTGEPVPEELIRKIVRAKNYMAGYQQVRQLQFGILDMAWHTLERLPEEGTVGYEKKVLGPYAVMPDVPEAAVSPAFNHIFSGGYAAGYYSYKWAEVLEADAFSLFRKNGIFDRSTAASFRENILSKGGTEDPDVLYRNFRGRDPDPEALMEKSGLIND